MPETLYPRVLGFIEGTMEHMFVKNNFHYVHCVRVSNGCGWTPERISKEIGSSFTTLNIDADLIVVWLDKEKHECTVEDFRDLITIVLEERGADPDKVCICIPNQMTENAILADEDLIRSEFGVPDYNYTFEGANGKRYLKQLYSNKDEPENYKETSHGLFLLKKMRLNRASQNSPSLALFANEMDLPCWWIDDAEN